MTKHRQKRTALSSAMTGAILLTASGLLSRIIGFFYRVFLSNTIGAEGMGIFQLISPVFTICYALTAGSYQTAISWFIAARCPDGSAQDPSPAARAQKGILKQRASHARICLAGLILSLSTSLLLCALLYLNRHLIAAHILLEERCESLIGMLALTVPLTAVHACISGYYYGIKRTGIPAAAQLVEQGSRVFCVYLIWRIALERGLAITPMLAVFGMLAGEFFSVLFLLLTVSLRAGRPQKAHPLPHSDRAPLLSLCRAIFLLSLPLIANRLLLSVLSSIEAIWIPSRLQAFGLSSSDALSVYGILTGMSMPFILFPSALTNSLAVVLLPEVAQAHSLGKTERIAYTATRNIHFCLTMGILFSGIFFFFGNDIGLILFGDSRAGLYIRILSPLCPFLYLGTTVGSILNGMGKTGTTFCQNCVSMLIRLAFIYLLIPVYGMRAYLWGIQASQLVLTGLHLLFLKKEAPFAFSFWRSILLPCFLFMVCLSPIRFLYRTALAYSLCPPALALIGCCAALLLAFACLYSAFSRLLPQLQHV